MNHSNYKISKVINEGNNFYEEYYELEIFSPNNYIIGTMKIRPNGAIDLYIPVIKTNDRLYDIAINTIAYVFKNKILKHIYKEYNLKQIKFDMRNPYMVAHLHSIAEKYDKKIKIHLNTGFSHYYIYDLNTKEITEG